MSGVVYRWGVTEIPEHLLKRSKERKDALSGAPAAESSTESSPAPVAKAPDTTPARAAEQPAPVVKPDPPHVAAARNRKKIPFWAMATLSLLPVWAFLYLLALRPAETEATGPLATGAEVYGACASCHGAAGAGGAGRQLSAGEVMKTFPNIEDMLNFVYNGSQRYRAAGIEVIGSPNREGGVHGILAYNGAPMPQQGQMAGGGLTDYEILGVVCHERYEIAGADPMGDEWAEEFAKWCSEDSEIWPSLQSGAASFDDLDGVGTDPRPSLAR